MEKKKKVDSVTLSPRGYKNSELGLGALLTSNNSHLYFKLKHPQSLSQKYFHAPFIINLISKSFLFPLQTQTPYALQFNTIHWRNSGFCTGSQKTHCLRWVTPIALPPVSCQSSSPHVKIRITPLWFQSRELSEPLSKFVHLIPIFPRTYHPFIHKQILLCADLCNRGQSRTPRFLSGLRRLSRAATSFPRLHPTSSQAQHAPRTPRTPRLTLCVRSSDSRPGRLVPPGVQGALRQEWRKRHPWSAVPEGPQTRNRTAFGLLQQKPLSEPLPWNPTDPTFTLSIAIGVASEKVLHIRHWPARPPLLQLGAPPQLSLRHGTNETRHCRKDSLTASFPSATWFLPAHWLSYVHCVHKSRPSVDICSYLRALSPRVAWAGRGRGLSRSAEGPRPR